MTVLDQIDSLAVFVVPVFAGALVSFLTALVTKEHLPSWATVAVNVVLTALAGAVQVAVFTATGDVKADFWTYALLVGITWVGNVAAYLQGAPKKLAMFTWNFGIGRKIDEAELGYMGKYADDDQSTQPE